MIEKYIQQLMEELKLGASSSPDEQKLLHITIAQAAISVKDLEPGAYFFAKIAPVPPLKKEELLMLLMKANFAGQGTGGGVIGLMEDESSLTLSLSLPYELGYRAFKEALEDYVNFVDYWKSEVDRHVPPSAER